MKWSIYVKVAMNFRQTKQLRKRENEKERFSSCTVKCMVDLRIQNSGTLPYRTPKTQKLIITIKCQMQYGAFSNRNKEATTTTSK